MLNARGDQVNARCFDAAVPQDVRQLHDVPAGAIERPRKEMAQIVWEYLRRIHASLLAERLHFRPDLLSGQALSASGEEYLAGGDFLFLRVFQQFSAQLARQQELFVYLILF